MKMDQLKVGLVKNLFKKIGKKVDEETKQSLIERLLLKSELDFKCCASHCGVVVENVISA
jgi:hypothetical protein